MTPNSRAGRVSFAEILSSLSVALDMVEGQPEGHAVRTCFLAMRLADELGMSVEEKTQLYFAAIVKDAGCSSNSARIHAMFGGEEFPNKRDVKFIDWTSTAESLKFAFSHTEPQGTIAQKLRRMISNAGQPGKVMDLVTEARCTAGAEIALMLGFDHSVSRAVLALDEHWDGRGSPRHLQCEEIPLFARILCLCQTMEVFASAYGPTAAYLMMRERCGKWFDPELCRAMEGFENEVPFWARHQTMLESATCTLEMPEAASAASDADIDQVCQAFAQIIDAKSTFTGEHSTRVTRYAVDMGEAFGMDADRLSTLKRAALLHDIGKLGVSNSILDKPGKLSDDEFHSVRRHPALTWHILSRINGFDRITEIAAAHHEKLDGTGYHMGLSAEQIDLDMRILATADVFDALTARRPYRDAMPVHNALIIMDADAGWHLDPECVAMTRELYGSQELMAA